MGIALALTVALVAAPLSLSGARALADAHSGSLEASRVAIEVSRAGVEAAGQLANPTLSISYGADDPRLQAGLDVKVPLFGQRGAAIGTAESESQVAVAAAALGRAQLHANVRRLYAALWAAQEQARLAIEAAKSAAELARLTAERFATGGVPLLDVEEAALAAKLAAQEQGERAAAVVAAQAELEASLGAPIEGIEAPQPTEAPSLEALLARVALHPELASLHEEEKVALARVHEEKTSLRPLPTLSLTAERFSDPTISWGLRAGLAFDLPLLSWNRGRVHQQESAVRLAQAEERAAEQRLAGQVRAARVRWGTASSRSQFYGSDFIAAAQRVLEMAQAGYRIGRTSILSVLQAQAALASARGRAIEAAGDAQRALADLEEAIGADL